MNVTDTIPAVCFMEDMCRLLNMSRSQFFALRAKGTFPIPELLPKIDRRVRFSGADVQRYLRNEFRRAS